MKYVMNIPENIQFNVCTCTYFIKVTKKNATILSLKEIHDFAQVVLLKLNVFINLSRTYRSTLKGVLQRVKFGILNIGT